MFINQKITKFLAFLFCFSIFLSISQASEDVPLNNIALNETPKPISPIIFEDFSGGEVNLKNYRGHIYEKQSNNVPIPAFIVGSAPSLDESIDVIKRYKDRAIIISCGTALGVLLGNGITPDFHVEMENTPEILDVIAYQSKTYDISPVRLVASYTVAPKIADHFSTAIYYLRANLSPAAIFSD